MVAGASIVGAAKVQQVEQVTRAIDSRLTEVDLKRLEDKYKLHRILGNS